MRFVYRVLSRREGLWDRNTQSVRVAALEKFQFCDDSESERVTHKGFSATLTQKIRCAKLRASDVRLGEGEFQVFCRTQQPLVSSPEPSPGVQRQGGEQVNVDVTDAPSP